MYLPGDPAIGGAPDLIGLKTAVPYAVIGAVIGEYIGSNAELGHFILYASQTYDAPALFSGIAALIVIVFVSNYGLTRTRAIRHPLAPCRWSRGSTLNNGHRSCEPADRIVPRPARPTNFEETDMLRRRDLIRGTAAAGVALVAAPAFAAFRARSGQDARPRSSALHPGCPLRRSTLPASANCGRPTMSITA